MTRDPKYDLLFEPIRIGPKTMKNRFYQTPHCTGLGVDSPGAQAALRGVKAEGGWAVVNTEYCSIHPESDDRPYVGARLWDDRDVRNLSLMTDKVHEHGALAGVELYYGGALGTGYETRLPSRGPSQIPSEATWFHSCYAMVRDEIRELQSHYVAAARRALAAGFDIVNVYGGEAGAVTQHFLMRFFNKRTDEYGGSLENRARFWRETIELVREAVGDTCAIAVRMCIDTLDGSDLGIRVGEEATGFVELADHLVDFWDFQVGGWSSSMWGEDAAPSRFSGENFAGRWVSEIRPHVTKPVVAVGRFTSPDTMIEVLRSGQQDIIGAARPSIADPFLPRKIEEGQLDEIRECIGCNICASRFNQGARIICTQNATMGEEYRRGWHPERFSESRTRDIDVLVVGAGPAGMECATVLGKRGIRRVHLVDAADDIGGALRWITTLPGLAEWARVISWRRTQLSKFKNVEVIRSVTLDTEAVRSYGADIVVVATGARWASDGLNPFTHDAIPGADGALRHVLTPEQVMLEQKPILGDRVLVYDCDGYFTGSAIAEKLAVDGYSVRLVTPLLAAAQYCYFTGEGFAVARRLNELDIAVAASHTVTSIGPGTVLAAGGSGEVQWDIDAIVLVTQRISNDALYRALRTMAPELPVYRIGDCVVPRLIADCIFDGHRLGREIDTEDPAVARPYIREHRLLGATDQDYEAVLTAPPGGQAGAR